MSPYLNFLCSRAFMISLGYMVLVIIDLALLTLGIYLGERATAAGQTHESHANSLAI